LEIFSPLGGWGKSAQATPGFPLLLINPVDETATFRFVKPESLINNRLKEEASSTNTLHVRAQLTPEHHPVARGRENTLAGLILYYL